METNTSPRNADTIVVLNPAEQARRNRMIEAILQGTSIADMGPFPAKRVVAITNEILELTQ